MIMRFLPLIVMLFLIPCALADTIVVEPGESIQSAINSAEDGDTIIVMEGTYEEKIILNKSIVLRGESATITFPHDSVIDVYADDFVIQGFTVESAPSYKAGIWVHPTSSGTIENCILLDNSYGVLVEGSTININECDFENNERYGLALLSNTMGGVSGCSLNGNGIAGVFVHDSTITASSCDFSENGYFGIYLGNSTECDVSECEFWGYYGIFLRKSDSNNIVRNIIHSERYGIVLLLSSDDNTLSGNTIEGGYGGIYVDGSLNNRIEENVVRGSGEEGEAVAIYFKDSGGNAVTNSYLTGYTYGIELYNASYNTITNCEVSSERAGILFVRGCENNRLEECSVSGGQYNVYVDSSRENTIRECEMTSGFIGVYLGRGDDNIVEDNSISECTYGIYLRLSTSNEISSNEIDTSEYSQVLLIGSSNNELRDNTCMTDGKGGIYIGSDSNGNIIVSDSYEGGDAGVVVIASRNNRISDCSINGSEVGVYVVYGTNNILESCIVNGDTGIQVDSGDGNVIRDCVVEGSYGVVLDGDENTLTNLRVSSIYRAIDIEGSRNVVEASTLPLTQQSIVIHGSSNIVRNDTISNSITGIWITGGRGNNIVGSEIQGCQYGMQIWNETEDTYIYNTTMSGATIGIFVLGPIGKLEVRNEGREVERNSEYQSGATPLNTTVLNSTLTNNRMDISFLWGEPTASIHYNDLSEGFIGVSALSINTTVDAEYNWWGSSDGPSPHGHGVRVVGNVDYEPWLESPPER